MKITQIVAFHESDRLNPTIVALCENGRLYSLPLIGGLKGTQEWAELPRIPGTK